MQIFRQKKSKKMHFSRFFMVFRSKIGQKTQKTMCNHIKIKIIMETKNLSTSERISEMLRYAIVNRIIIDKGAFASFLGVSPSTLSRYLSGKKIPPESTMRKFNDKFGNIFNDQWLVLGIGEMLNGNQPDNALAIQTTANATAPIYQNNGNGGNNVTQNNVNGELLAIIRKRDEQIDRLLTIIETINKQQQQ